MTSKNLKVLAGLVTVLAVYGCNESVEYGVDVVECNPYTYKWACTEDGMNLKKCSDNSQVILEVCDYGCAGARCKSVREGQACNPDSFSTTCVDGNTLEICLNNTITTQSCTKGCVNNQCRNTTVDPGPDPGPGPGPGPNPNENAPAVQSCGTLTISGSDTCEMTGSGSKIVLRGDVLALDKTYAGGSVVIEGQKITYVGCDPDLNGATVITCPESVISPGLINAHDHITYDNTTPDSWGDERFDHRMDWRKAVYGHTYHNGKSTNANDVHELRMLMSGVTSLFGSVGSDYKNLKGLVRNIDTESIGGVKNAKYDTFPLSDNSEKTYRTSCSQYKDNTVNVNNFSSYGPHIGEGINDAALLELKCLSGEGAGSQDLFTEKLAIIHGVASTPAIIALMSERKSKLIWSPRTNISLYGDTANAITYDNLGVTIALGTDWILSGSANMLREFACVNTLNQLYYNNHFSDYDIWLMGTYNGAVALGFDSVIGQLKAGYYADIAMYQKSDGRSAHGAVTGAANKDVLLVMIDGQIAFGNANIVPDKSNCSTDTIGGVSKKICPNGTSRSYEAIKSSAQYALFFDGNPPREPTCIPQRTRPEDTKDTSRYDGNLSDNFSDPNDTDGDGIPNAQDNCPNVFNPIRPQDNVSGIYAQSDADSDGIGDACDPYPLCAENNSTCPVFNTKDGDNDSIPNTTDNCPNIANPDQADADADGMGDLCDPCPNEKNLSDGSCPINTFTSIQDINTAILAGCPAMDANCSTGNKYKTSGRVTAVAPKGFFIQTADSTAPGSGLYIYTNATPTVALNDDVTVQGTAASYFGLNQLTAPAIEKTGTGAAIAPVTIASSDLRSYIGMLVQFSNLTISEIVSPDKNPAYKFDQLGGTDIHLGNYIWTITPAPVVGANYPSATGILVYDYNLYRVSPRSAADLAQGDVPLAIASVNASASSAQFGSQVNITINMNQSVESSIQVAVACGSATCATSAAIAAGTSSVTIPVTMASSGNTTVTVTYDGKSSSVTIIGTSGDTPPSGDFTISHTATFDTLSHNNNYASTGDLDLGGGITLTYQGQDNDVTSSNAYVNAIVLTGNAKTHQNHITINGMAGVGTVKIDWRSYKPIDDKGVLVVKAGSAEKTINFVTNQTGPTTLTFNDASATSIVIHPEYIVSGNNKTNRIAIDGITFTSTK